MEQETRLHLQDAERSVTLWFRHGKVEMEVWTDKNESGMGKRFSEEFDLEQFIEQLMMPRN